MYFYQHLMLRAGNSPIRMRKKKNKFFNSTLEALFLKAKCQCAKVKKETTMHRMKMTNQESTNHTKGIIIIKFFNTKIK